jgi:hypothetical protein
MGDMEGRPECTRLQFSSGQWIWRLGGMNGVGDWFIERRCGFTACWVVPMVPFLDILYALLISRPRALKSSSPVWLLADIANSLFHSIVLEPESRATM